MTKMEPILEAARSNLLQYETALLSIYPDMVSIGTPCYTVPPRVSFMLKMRNGKYKCTLASRLVLEATLGRQLTENETCDHIDGNVCNDSPNNLQVLSRSDNSRKGASPETQAKALVASACSRKGKAQASNSGSSNGMPKLTESQVSAICARLNPYTRGLDSILAAEYGVSRSLISSIRRGVHWASV